jgi:hypothetical protein
MRKQQKETRTVIDALDLGRLDFHFLDIPLYSFNYEIEKGRREKRQKQETERRKKKMEESGTSSAHERLMLMCTGALSHFYRATLTVLFL